MNSKLSKLASTFDKELADRDKTLKQIQSSLINENQTILSKIQLEMEGVRRVVNEMEGRKAEKREITEFRH